MKTIQSILFLLICQVAFGQNLVETRTASLVDGDYALEGTVYLEVYDDNSIDLRFDSDYLTQTDVFDVHVFLTNSTNYASPIDTSGMLLVENIGTISGLNYSSGAMTFDLPAGVGINDYDHIVFICIQYGQLHWGNGEFGESVPATAGLEEQELLEVNLYPNPSPENKVKIDLQNDQESVLLEVFSRNGSRAYNYNLDEQSGFIELEDSGVYFLKFTTDKGSVTKKLVRL